MRYDEVQKGFFEKRLNRFTAQVWLGEELELVHVKNTGRLGELLLPGAEVVLSKAKKVNRKTQYDLIGVYREGLGLVNVDSQAPNRVVAEWLRSPLAKPYFPNLCVIKPEYTIGASRMDFYLESQNRAGVNKKILIEVKGVSLERDGVCYFPDAPTTRGVRHIEELIRAVNAGYDCYLAFVIQMRGVDRVFANDAAQPEFGEAWERAKKAGVKIGHLGCEVTENTIWVDRAQWEE